MTSQTKSRADLATKLHDDEPHESMHGPSGRNPSYELTEGMMRAIQESIEITFGEPPLGDEQLGSESGLQADER